MPGIGIIWGAIISIPLWLIVIVLVSDGSSALNTLGVAGLLLLGLLLFLILISSLLVKLRGKDLDEYIKGIPTHAIRSKTHPKDSSEISTLG